MIDQIAPWVEISKKDNALYLLGPYLTVLATTNDDVEKIDTAARQFLWDKGFMSAETKANCAPEPIFERVRIGDVDLTVSSRQHTSAVKRLASALADIGTPGTSRTTAPLQVSLDLDFHEPLSDEMECDFPTLLFSEGYEGTHIGPLIADRAEWERFIRASQDWSSTGIIRSMGFSRLPCRLFDLIHSDAIRIAQAILFVLQNARGTCILVDDMRAVMLRPSEVQGAISPGELTSLHAWSKGFIKNLASSPFSGASSGFIAMCNVPARAIEFLEGNSGAGLTADEAQLKCIAEGVERYSAFCANDTLTPSSSAVSSRNTYALSRFHVMDKDLEHAQAHDRHLTNVIDEISQTEFAIPECLVPFPYVPKGGLSFHATTAGLATHTSRAAAIRHAVLELLERENLYKNFLHLRPGICVGLDSLAALNDDVAGLLCEIRALNISAYFLVFDTDSSVPIVHCFLDDCRSGFYARGTGSGSSEAAASLKALMEAMMLREHFLSINAGANTDNPYADAYVAWTQPKTRDSISQYLLRQPTRDASREIHEPLTEAFKYLQEKQLPLLVADLPCIVKGWSSVRALIPTFTTHPVGSSSDGGRKLLNPAFKHGLPV